MGKAIVCVTSIHVFEGKPVINFDVVAEGMTRPRGTNYIMDPALSPDENIAALWQQAAEVVKEDGIKMDDPTQFIGIGLPKTQAGAPITKAELDAAEVKAETVADTKVTLTARFMSGLRSAMNA